MCQKSLFEGKDKPGWVCFGGVDIRNTKQLHAIPTNRFNTPEKQKKNTTR